MTDFSLQFAVVRDDLLSSDRAVTVRDGLNVVYGLNGAGKTRFLTGVRNAIRGVGGLGVALLVRLPTGQEGSGRGAIEPSAGFHQTVPLAVLAKSLATTADFDHFVPGTVLSERRLSEHVANKVVERYLATLVPPSGPAREWSVRNRLFLFIPAGRPGAPLWKCWAVADPFADWAHAEMIEAAQLWRRYDADHVPFDEDEQGNEAHEEWFREAKRALTLLPDEEALDFLDLGPFRPLSYGMAIPPEPITVDGPIDFGVDLASEAGTADDATASYLRGQVDRGDVLLEDAEEPPLEAAAATAAAALADAVTRRLGRALIDSPVARLTLTPPSARLFDPPFVWTFSRRPRNSPGVTLQGLSRAERSWAERSIIESAAELSQRVARGANLYLYDEPESALHRAAEAYMASSLVERAMLPGVTILAATHSPELLDSLGANLLEIRRSDRKSLIQTLDAVSRSNLDELGLNPSDLLRLTRVYLAVEGHHDEVLINHFLGERLRRARVEVLPLHGGKRLPHTIDSRVLFDHTNAHLVGLLDNADASLLSQTWSAAQELAATGHVADAKDLILDRIGKDSGETQYMSAWLTRALDRGLQSRLTPMALSKADIIEYLPVNKVVAGASSWSGLRDEHANALATKTGTPRDFKKWLAVRFKVSFGTEDLLRFAGGVEVPQDFELLAKTVEAIAADRENSLA